MLNQANSYCTPPTQGIYVYENIPAELKEKGFESKYVQCKDFFTREKVGIGVYYCQSEDKYFVELKNLMPRYNQNEPIYPDILFRIDWEYYNRTNGKWLGMSVLSINGYSVDKRRKLRANKRQMILTNMIEHGYYPSELYEEISGFASLSSGSLSMDEANKQWTIDMAFLWKIMNQWESLGVADENWKATVKKGLNHYSKRGEIHQHSYRPAYKGTAMILNNKPVIELPDIYVYKKIPAVIKEEGLKKCHACVEDRFLKAKCPVFDMDFWYSPLRKKYLIEYDPLIDLYRNEHYPNTRFCIDWDFGDYRTNPPLSILDINGFWSFYDAEHEDLDWFAECAMRGSLLRSTACSGFFIGELVDEYEEECDRRNLNVRYPMDCREDLNDYLRYSENDKIDEYGFYEDSFVDKNHSLRTNWEYARKWGLTRYIEYDKKYDWYVQNFTPTIVI